jgi:hypothetical protein
MELPIQLKFFKKLELYQELKSQNKKAFNRDEAWLIEKEILKWTRWNHHHLNTPLTNEYIFSPLNKVLPQNLRNNLDLIHVAMRNLVARKYATGSHASITITAEGLLMGEVIDDVEGTGTKNYLENKYFLFYYFIWTIAILGGLTIIINFIHSLHFLLWLSLS